MIAPYLRHVQFCSISFSGAEEATVNLRLLFGVKNPELAALCQSRGRELGN